MVIRVLTLHDYGILVVVALRTSEPHLVLPSVLW